MTVTTQHRQIRQLHTVILTTLLQLGAAGTLGTLGCENTPDNCKGCGEGGNANSIAGAPTSITGGFAGAGGAYVGERNQTTTAGTSSTSSTLICSGWSTLERLTPVELHDMLETSDPLLVNVHTPYEGELPDTDATISYTDIDSIEKFAHYDRCADIVLTCLSGGMSVSAGNKLVQRGYLRVRELLGGMNAWQAAGYPIEYQNID